jgi:deoxycytidine triphosphate deaminase
MPIGPKILLKQVKTKKLVESLSERELTNPEGAGFDIRLGEVFELVSGKGNFLGITERKTPEVKSLAVFEKGKEKLFSFKKNKYYLVKTIETVNLPKEIAGYVFSRSTLFRSGLLLEVTQIAPGYCGELTFGLFNAGKMNIKIALGARIAHVQFEHVDGGGSSYRGQWQGGRVSATKREIQV